MKNSTLNRLPGFEPLLVPGFAVLRSSNVDLARLGIFSGIAGGDQGTNAEGDVLTQTIDGRDLNDLWSEFQETMRLQNAQRTALVDFLTFGVSEPVEDVPQWSGADFEKASEFGEPKGLRGAGFFSLGYTFEDFDLAARFTWKFLRDATAQQVESVNALAIEADNRLLFLEVMRTIFNVNNLEVDINQRAYPVYRFYNNDGTTPPTVKLTSFTNTHTHYLTSGAAVVDSVDLDDMVDHLQHHGYTPDSGVNLVVMVNKQQGRTIRTFRIANGASWDFVPATGGPAMWTPGQGITGTQVGPELSGLTVIGSYGHLVVVEEDYIPPGYMFAFVTGGRDNLRNPVGFREHRNAAFRGLRLVKGRTPDYPLIDSFYQRSFGTGIRQRGAGVVMQVTANANYAAPAVYAA